MSDYIKRYRCPNILRFPSLLIGSLMLSMSSIQPVYADEILDYLPAILSASKGPIPQRTEPQIKGRVRVWDYQIVPRFGAFAIVGIVYNDSNAAALNTRIQLRNDQFEVSEIEGSFGLVSKRLIAPGDTACFEVLVIPEQRRFDTSNMRPFPVAEAYQFREVPEVSISSTRYLRTHRGNVEINANIFVRGDRWIPGPPAVILQSRDSNGSLLSCRRTRLASFGLEPGRRYRLDVSTTTPFDETRDYEIFIDGDY